MKLTNNFEDIVLNNRPLLDVRAPIEFGKGAFPGSVNIPIMTDEERHLVGIKFKEDGNEAATTLGHTLVSGDVKANRINQWITFIQNNPEALLYCFRGGSRSRITQEWLHETGVDITRLEGGYKAFRNYLIDNLQPEAQTAKPLILTGYTGSGKTIVLHKLDNAIDLESIAHHRGSAFGNYIEDQPSQIDFENLLAYKLIQHRHSDSKHMVLEDESRNVGKCYIPKDLLAFFRSGSYVLLDISLEERIAITYEEYVLDSQKRYIDHYGSEGLEMWYQYIQTSMNKVRKKLGGDRLKVLKELFDQSFKHQCSTNNPLAHRNWIEVFLRDYYDPMYKYQFDQHSDRIVFKGNHNEVVEYIESLS